MLLEIFAARCTNLDKLGSSMMGLFMLLELRSHLQVFALGIGQLGAEYRQQRLPAPHRVAKLGVDLSDDSAGNWKHRCLFVLVGRDGAGSSQGRSGGGIVPFKCCGLGLDLRGIQLVLREGNSQSLWLPRLGLRRLTGRRWNLAAR